jgi:hypothetical protein
VSTQSVLDCFHVHCLSFRGCVHSVRFGLFALLGSGNSRNMLLLKYWLDYPVNFFFLEVNSAEIIVTFSLPDAFLMNTQSFKSQWLLYLPPGLRINILNFSYRVYLFLIFLQQAVSVSCTEISSWFCNPDRIRLLCDTNLNFCLFPVGNAGSFTGQYLWNLW